MKNRSVQEPANSFESAEGHLRNVMDSLSIALSEAKQVLQMLVQTRPSERKTRVLQRHSAVRKRIVSRFLSWCWNAEDDCGFDGAIPETVAEEFRLYDIWAKRICPTSERSVAIEIDTLGEYSACREGLRKMLPAQWRELQIARNALLGRAVKNGPKHHLTP